MGATAGNGGVGRAVTRGREKGQEREGGSEAGRDGEGGDEWSLGSDERFLVYASHSGFNNQVLGFARALHMAALLNRTLVVPPKLSHQSGAGGNLDPATFRDSAWAVYSRHLLRADYVSMADVLRVGAIPPTVVRTIDLRHLVARLCACDVAVPCWTASCHGLTPTTSASHQARVRCLQQCGARLGAARLPRAGLWGALDAVWGAVQGAWDEGRELPSTWEEQGVLYRVPHMCNETLWTIGNYSSLRALRAMVGERVQRPIGVCMNTDVNENLPKPTPLHRLLLPHTAAATAKVMAFGSMFRTPIADIRLHFGPGVNQIREAALPFFSQLIVDAAVEFVRERLRRPYACVHLRGSEPPFSTNLHSTLSTAEASLASIVRRHGSAAAAGVPVFLMTDLDRATWQALLLPRVAALGVHVVTLDAKALAARMSHLSRALRQQGAGIRANRLPPLTQAKWEDHVAHNGTSFSMSPPGLPSQITDIQLFVEQVVCCHASLGTIITPKSTTTPLRCPVLLAQCRAALQLLTLPAPSASRSAAPRLTPCCSPHVAPCCPARRALLPHASRPAAASASRPTAASASCPAALHSARPAALSTARPALQPAECPARPSRAAQPEPPCPSAGGAAGAGAAKVGQRWSLPLLDDPTPQQLRKWVLQRARPVGGGFGFLRTAQRQQQSQQETFSPQVLSELFPQRCVTGSVEAAALGASESAAALGACEFVAASGARASPSTGPSSAEALHTFTLDSGASRCFFRDCTTLTPLAAPIPVSLADPTGGPVVARASTALPCPTFPSGSLSRLHLPMFSTNLVSNAAIQDVWVDTLFREGSVWRFVRQVAASSQVSASGQLVASCSCPVLLHQTLRWHHCLGHPSLPRLRSMHSRLLVCGLPRSLPSLLHSPALPCLPCVEGWQRTAPHSSEFPPTTAPMQTLHMDVWGPAPVRGTDQDHYFLLVVDNYTRYTTVFPLRRKADVSGDLIPWIHATRRQLRELFSQDFPVLRLHSDRGGEFSSDLLAEFCQDEGIVHLARVRALRALALSAPSALSMPLPSALSRPPRPQRPPRPPRLACSFASARALARRPSPRPSPSPQPAPQPVAPARAPARRPSLRPSPSPQPAPQPVTPARAPARRPSPRPNSSPLPAFLLQQPPGAAATAAAAPGAAATAAAAPGAAATAAAAPGAATTGAAATGAATPAAAAQLSLYSGSGLAVAAVVRLLFSPLVSTALPVLLLLLLLLLLLFLLLLLLLAWPDAAPASPACVPHPQTASGVVELLRLRVDIYSLDYDAILTAMYALPTSDEGDCYLCVPPDPGLEAAALGAGEAAALGASASSAPGAGESALFGTASAQVFHTFTLDLGASRSFFRDRTTLTSLSRPVAVSLADPSGGPVLASFSTVLPCPAAPSGTLSGLYLPSFSTNLVSGADLQDQGVDQFTPASQRVTHCTCARTGRHLATFTRRPGSSLYTLSTESPPVAASGQVAASSQVFAAASGSGPESVPCSCRLLSHQTLLWRHCLGPAPTCVPCDEGRQRAAPHSSEFPPTAAPLQTLHMDVWGPARVRGQGHERYFLLVVDDYSRYTTVFPLRSKGDVTEVLIDWIRAARLQLRESFGSDFPVLRLHSERGGEFSSACLGAFCRAQGIRQTFTLPASPQQNGIAERRIGMVMDVARTSMIHAAAPHFLWPFASGGAERGGAESEGAVPGGAESGGAAPGGAERGGTELGGAESARVASRSASSRRELLSPQELREWFARRWSRAVGAGGPPVAPGPGGACTGGTGAVEIGGAAAAAGVGPVGASGATGAGATGGVGAGVGPAGGTAWATGGTGAAGPAGVGAVGAGGAAGTGAATGGPGLVPVGTGDPAQPRPYFVPLLEQVLGLPPSPSPAPPLDCPQPVQSQSPLQPVSPLPAPSPYAGPTGGLAERREPASRPALPVRTTRSSRRAPRPRPPAVPGTHQMTLRPSTAPLRVSLLSPPESSLPVLAAPTSDSLRAASLTIAHLLSTVVTDPSFESTAASALVAELVDFAAHCRLDYAASLVAESASSAMDAEMASWKSTGTYVDEVPPPRANIISGMWIFRVKRPSGSPPVFKVRYVARGFSQRQGVDYFQTFSPTPKMTTLQALPHVAAQRDYELHSLDFSTAFLQGSLHEEIWLRRPPGFTGSFPPAT
ncbi:unnamed protein product [Closterium sp. NIES-54]